MRKVPVRCDEYLYRLAQERARWVPPQPRRIRKLLGIYGFSGSQRPREKTILFVIDGLYGNDNVDGPPHRKRKMAPFNDAWPNSIFMSLDGVAIDSVGFDLLTTEWPDLPDIAKYMSWNAELDWAVFSSL